MVGRKKNNAPPPRPAPLTKGSLRQDPPHLPEDRLRAPYLPGVGHTNTNVRGVWPTLRLCEAAAVPLRYLLLRSSCRRVLER